MVSALPEKHRVFTSYQLRETGSQYWPGNEKATNATGFSARPGGWLRGAEKSFFYFGKRTAWWAPKDKNTPTITIIAERGNGIWTAMAGKGDKVYIRCVED